LALRSRTAIGAGTSTVSREACELPVKTPVPYVDVICQGAWVPVSAWKAGTVREHRAAGAVMMVGTTMATPSRLSLRNVSQGD
jgi:hypothetical protein